MCFANPRCKLKPKNIKETTDYIVYECKCGTVEREMKE